MNIFQKIKMVFYTNESDLIKYHSEALINILDIYAKKPSGLKLISIYYDYNHDSKRRVSVQIYKKEFNYDSDTPNDNYNPNKKII